VPVKGISWLQVRQTAPVLPSFAAEPAPRDDRPRLPIQVLQATRISICSSVASSGAPKMVPSPESKWPQPEKWRILGCAPVFVPSRRTGYDTNLILGYSTVRASAIRPAYVEGCYGGASSPNCDMAFLLGSTAVPCAFRVAADRMEPAGAGNRHLV
jgi:hypothetical protein